MSASKRVLFGRYVRAALAIVDCILFNLLFWVAMLIHPNYAVGGTPNWLMWMFINISFLPVLLYVSRIKEHSFRVILLDKVFIQAITAVGIHALFFLSLIAFFDIEGLTTSFYVTYYCMLALAETLWSLFSRKLIKHFRRRGYNYMKVAIVGTNSTSERLFKEMQSDPGYGYRVLGFFDKMPQKDFCGKYTGHIDELEDFVRDNDVDQIYFTLSGKDESLTKVVKIADDNVAEFLYVPMISPYVVRNFHAQNIGCVPVLAIRNNPLKQTQNKIIKRVFDLVFSSIALLFYFPFVYIPIGLTIKLTSKGPIYFKQERTGYKGKPFVCLKFRSMAVNRQADTKQATKGDARVTNIGKFIRRTSIDELPQFINVFKGDMSVVGPRPHMLKHTEEYSKLVDQYMVRHLIKPGITGWAQVNGYRGQTDELWKMEKRVENDVWYLEHWSFMLDMKIIVRTVINAFKRDENAF